MTPRWQGWQNKKKIVLVLLIAAIVAQVIILGFAGFQLIRQRRG